ncbi:hypothetical protein L7F22_051154 [Adiantum nelumboides]|nr:hypothetical protein [Adiantum nelumboides]
MMGKPPIIELEDMVYTSAEMPIPSFGVAEAILRLSLGEFKDTFNIVDSNHIKENLVLTKSWKNIFFGQQQKVSTTTGTVPKASTKKTQPSATEKGVNALADDKDDLLNPEPRGPDRQSIPVETDQAEAGFVAVFVIVLAGFGLRQVFASRLLDMADACQSLSSLLRDLMAQAARLDATTLTTSEADVVYEVTHNGEVVLASMCTLEVLMSCDGTLSLQWMLDTDAPFHVSQRLDVRMSLPSGALLVLRRVCHVPSLTRSLISSSEMVVCTPTEVRQLEPTAGSCETQLVVQGLCPNVDFSVARQESSDSKTMTCVDDRHDDALRSFKDMPLPMSDSLSHGTSCVDVIAKEIDACEPCMAMFIDTESVDKPDFREPETDVLFYDTSDMFEDDSVLQTSMYDHCESAMIADSA